MIVSRHAVARLAEENLVSCHQGAPTLVRGCDCRPWSGYVVYICSEGELVSVAWSSFFQILSKELSLHGFLFEIIPLPFRANRSRDLSGLVPRLGRKIDLAMVSIPDDRRLWRVLERTGVPCCCFREPQTRIRNFVGVVKLAVEADAFLALCKRKSVKRVFWACVETLDWFSLIRDRLIRGGLQVDVESVRAFSGVGTSAKIELRAGMVFRRQIRKWKAVGFPDLIVISDDYIARGALYALAEYGVRIPEDVGVVTMVNQGFEYFAPCRLTCFVRNTIDFAKDTARFCLDFARRRSVGTDGVVIRYSFCRGDSF